MSISNIAIACISLQTRKQRSYFLDPAVLEVSQLPTHLSDVVIIQGSFQAGSLRSSDPTKKYLLPLI